MEIRAGGSLDRALRVLKRKLAKEWGAEGMEETDFLRKAQRASQA
jgi:ribosomal protein S21